MLTTGRAETQTGWVGNLEKTLQIDCVFRTIYYDYKWINARRHLRLSHFLSTRLITELIVYLADSDSSATSVQHCI